MDEKIKAQTGEATQLGTGSVGFVRPEACLGSVIHGFALLPLVPLHLAQGQARSG